MQAASGRISARMQAWSPRVRRGEGSTAGGVLDRERASSSVVANEGRPRVPPPQTQSPRIGLRLILATTGTQG